MRISYSGTIYELNSFFPEGLEDVDYDLFLKEGYLKEVHPQVEPAKSVPVTSSKSSTKHGSNQPNPEPTPSNS